MSNDLKKLQKKWYKKLKDSGFDDIERADGTLKVYASMFQHGETPTTYEARQRYFEQARELLHTSYLQDAEERAVWRLHADGARPGEISKRVGISTYRVTRIVSDVQRRYIKPRQS